jgi:hypothetical protein
MSRRSFRDELQPIIRKQYYYIILFFIGYFIGSITFYLLFSNENNIDQSIRFFMRFIDLIIYILVLTIIVTIILGFIIRKIAIIKSILDDEKRKLNNEIYGEIKFPFYKESFLIARIKNSGIQSLIFKIGDKETTHGCIYTVINHSNTKGFLKKNQDKLNIKIGRFNKKLNIEEKFFAFKSWVQGIAELKIDSLVIQGEIEIYGTLEDRVSSFLFENLIEMEEKFIYDYLDYLEKKIKKANSESYLIASLLPLIKYLIKNEPIKTNEIFKFLINEIGFPIEYFYINREEFKYSYIGRILSNIERYYDIKCKLIPDNSSLNEARRINKEFNIFLEKKDLKSE